jgi:hypothetical protein
MLNEFLFFVFLFTKTRIPFDNLYAGSLRYYGTEAPRVHTVTYTIVPVQARRAKRGEAKTQHEKIGEQD